MRDLVDLRAGLNVMAKRKNPFLCRESNFYPYSVDSLIQVMFQEVPNSNLGWDTDYTDDFRDFPHPLANAAIVLCNTRVYPKVFELAAWSQNFKWLSSLPLGAVVSLFCKSV
jgi:hypothetical protein